VVKRVHAATIAHVPSKHGEESDNEREAIERDERAAFERRAEWWRLHYRDEKDVDERTRQAAEHADRMPSEDEA
jgi:hypothetical protein